MLSHPLRVGIWQMRYRENDFVLWQDEEVREGNVASQMICVPNIPEALGTWTNRYESDHDFVESTCRNLGEPVWHDQEIALVHHPHLRDFADLRDPPEFSGALASRH